MIDKPYTSQYFYKMKTAISHHLKNQIMNYHINTFRTMGSIAIAAIIFIAFFLVYFNLFQSMINFVLTYQGTGLQQYR